MSERRAVDLIGAAGTGVVLTMIDQPEGELPSLTALTSAERALLGVWLDRIADSQYAAG